MSKVNNNDKNNAFIPSLKHNSYNESDDNSQDDNDKDDVDINKNKRRLKG